MENDPVPGPVHAGADATIGTPGRMLADSNRTLWFAGFGQYAYDPAPDGNFAVMSSVGNAPQRVILIQNWRALLERSR